MADEVSLNYNDIDSGKLLNKAGLLELSGQIKGYIQANTPSTVLTSQVDTGKVDQTTNDPIFLDDYLDDLEQTISNTTTYTLPTASTSTLGGVKVDGSTITIDQNGVISSSGGGGSSYTFTNGLTESSGAVSYDLYDSVKLKTNDKGYNSGNAICIGRYADMSNCNGKYCVAIGADFGGAYADYTTVIGGGTARGQYGVAIGYGSNSWGPYSISIGPNTEQLTDNAGYFPLVFGVGRRDWLGGRAPFNKTGGAWADTGDLFISGDLYIECNDFRTERFYTPSYYEDKRLKTANCGGSKVATEAYVNSKIPTAPVSDGTYILMSTVSSGTATQTWENVVIGGSY